VSLNLGDTPVGSDPARYIATMHVAFWLLAAVTAAALLLSLAKRASAAAAPPSA
jgi:hypothetical protein